jgi:hypothetical protein
MMKTTRSILTTLAVAHSLFGCKPEHQDDQSDVPTPNAVSTSSDHRLDDDQFIGDSDGSKRFPNMPDTYEGIVAYKGQSLIRPTGDAPIGAILRTSEEVAGRFLARIVVKPTGESVLALVNAPPMGWNRLVANDISPIPVLWEEADPVWIETSPAAMGWVQVDKPSSAILYQRILLRDVEKMTPEAGVEAFPVAASEVKLVVASRHRGQGSWIGPFEILRGNFEQARRERSHVLVTDEGLAQFPFFFAFDGDDQRLRWRLVFFRDSILEPFYHKPDRPGSDGLFAMRFGLGDAGPYIADDVVRALPEGESPIRRMAAIHYYVFKQQLALKAATHAE